MKIFNIILIVMLVLVFSFEGFATNYAKNQTVYVEEKPNMVRYYGTFTSVTGNTTGDIWRTQAIYIGFINKEYTGYEGRFSILWTNGGGTEDFNVFIDYTNDPSDSTTWVAGTTDAGLDATGTTAVQDTIGIRNGTTEKKFRAYNWMRIRVLAGADVGASVGDWDLIFRKPEGIQKEYVGMKKDSQ